MADLLGLARSNQRMLFGLLGLLCFLQIDGFPVSSSGYGLDNKFKDYIPSTYTTVGEDDDRPYKNLYLSLRYGWSDDEDNSSGSGYSGENLEPHATGKKQNDQILQGRTKCDTKMSKVKPGAAKSA